MDGVFYELSGTESADRIYNLRRIVGRLECGKIFPFQNLSEIGLAIQVIYLCLLQTMTFFTFNISGVFAVRTGINALQIIFRIAVM